MGSGLIEGLREALSSSHEHRAIGENNRVVERTAEVHVRSLDDFGLGADLVDGDEVGVVEGFAADIVEGTTESEDLAVVKHHSVSTHAISVSSAVAVSSKGCRPGVSGSVPVHPLAGTGLEDRSLLPAEEPAVVVAAVSMYVLGEHRGHFRVIEIGPLVLDGIIDGTVLLTGGFTERTANHEDAAIGEDCCRLVASVEVESGAVLPLTGGGVVDTGVVRTVAASDEQVAEFIVRDSSAEHVMAGVADFSLRDSLLLGVPGGRLRLRAGVLQVSVVLPRSPADEFSSGRVYSSRDWDQREVDGGTPGTLGGIGLDVLVLVDIQLGDVPSALVDGEAQVSALFGLEGRQFLTGIRPPHAIGNLVPGLVVLADGDRMLLDERVGALVRNHDHPTDALFLVQVHRD